ncbi:MAG: N-acetyl-gamma-glutamyl-phosphate reductase [Coriobacteriia bacterium]|nr:N-acetyl-gamma-glutamyl-phosphate reductase [Coriobacteriia bacterium]
MTQGKTQRAAVIGATGFTGVELVSILQSHPVFELMAATARCHAGARLSSLYPALQGDGVAPGADVVLSSAAELDSASIDIAFLAVPHTAAMHLAPKLIEAGVRVIDLSADFRLKDLTTYEYWYAEHTAPALIEQALYALPELVAHADIAAAPLLACPGCYPTAAALAAAPLVASALAVPDAPLVIDAKSGISGAGRTASEMTQFCALDESVSAYKVAAHQHTPEIEQTLSVAAGREVTVLFTPHLAPMKRGLLATTYITCAERTTLTQLEELYHTAYAIEPFVTVLEQGTQPKTASVTGTNHAQIGVAFDERTHTAIITCAIDNLGKGASSQAVQVANIAYELDQAMGLSAFRSIV